MADTLHLELSTRQAAASILRQVRLNRDSGGPSTEISYEILEGGIPETPRVFDGYLFGILLHAMETGLPLRVHGPVSRSALYNLEDVQAFWRLWRPERYKHVDIVPDAIVDLERKKPARKAIAAFSGGVDSTFSVLRHRNHAPGTEAYNVDTALMVHGFDIGLSNRDGLKMAMARARPFLDKMGVTLRVIRTTSKERGLQNWEDSHAGQLACCLHQFSDQFEFGLIGSSGSYLDAELPYGSNPVLDHLYSGDAFGIIYDAAGFLKMDKIAAIAKDPVASAGIRVCWEGKDQGQNCGRCGKCLRTRIFFMILGVPDPPCFNGAFDTAAIRTMTIGNYAEWVRVKEIADYVQKNGVSASWVRPLYRRMAAYKRKELISNFSMRAGDTLDRIGLKQVAKSSLRALGLMR